MGSNKPLSVPMDDLADKFITCFEKNVESSWPQKSDRQTLEAALSDNCKIEAVKYRWDLMESSSICPYIFDSSYQIVPISNREYGPWRESAINAYKSSVAAYPTDIKSFLKATEICGVDINSSNLTKDVSSLNRISLVNKELRSSIQCDRETLDILLQDSKLIIYDDYYIALLRFIFAYIFLLLLNRECKKAYDTLLHLYIDRCILPMRFFAQLIEQIEVRRADLKAIDIKDPNVIMNIGDSIKERAENEWKKIRENCKNYDEWFYGLYRLAPLFGASEMYYKNAAQAYEKKGEIKKKNEGLKEAYSSEEMRVECCSTTGLRGHTYIGLYLDMMRAIDEGGIERAKKTAYYSFAGLPRIPGFLLDSITEFLDNNSNQNNISKQFFANLNEICKEKLDDWGKRLFDEGKKEFKKEKTSSNSELIDKNHVLNMLGCPKCGEKRLKFKKLKTKPQTPNNHELVAECKNWRCRQEYKIEHGVVKWGFHYEMPPLIVDYY